MYETVPYSTLLLAVSKLLIIKSAIKAVIHMPAGHVTPGAGKPACLCHVSS